MSSKHGSITIMQSFRVRKVSASFENFAYRAPMKFRAAVVDRVTILNVEVECDANGETAQGFGSMSLGNVWSFPSLRLTFDQTLSAMRQLSSDLRALIESSGAEGHPIEINHQLEPQYFTAANAIALSEPIPPLCTLVVASAFDAAIHDAYGKVNGTSSYQTYGPDYMAYDLGRYLDAQFRGEYPDRYISPRSVPNLYLYHLVGALDPLTAVDLSHPIGDGMPETLEDWVRAERLSHIKIKLDGNDLAWDVNRIISIHRVLSALNPREYWHYSLDFNERCQTVGYLLECLAKVREHAADAFERVQYLEQPTHRNLNAPDTPDMREAAAVKPVVIDESLVDYASLLRARELGYSGVALKACKGQSNALLMAAAAKKFGMFLCMQDLTCPGASLLHSASLAAHIPPLTAVEGNARQYVPAANKPWEPQFPRFFHVSDGRLDMTELDGPGLGVVPVHANYLQEN
jgi:L-alanine-DL-glutamate epimerase-like enolase superfamily enzyme